MVLVLFSIDYAWCWSYAAMIMCIVHVALVLFSNNYEHLVLVLCSDDYVHVALVLFSDDYAHLALVLCSDDYVHVKFVLLINDFAWCWSYAAMIMCM